MIETYDGRRDLFPSLRLLRHFLLIYDASLLMTSSPFFFLPIIKRRRDY